MSTSVDNPVACGAAKTVNLVRNEKGKDGPNVDGSGRGVLDDLKGGRSQTVFEETQLKQQDGK
jgi:hypothetical protein